MSHGQLALRFGKPATATRDAGHEHAADPFTDAQLAALRDHLVAYAKRGAPFTVEGWQGALPQPLWEHVERHGNIKGMLFRWASKGTNQIVKTGASSPAVRASARHRSLPLWRHVDR